MGKFKFAALHHVAFATAEMDKTIRYWRDLLGFKIVLGLGREKEKQYAFQISPQMLIFFFEWPEVEKVKPKRHGEKVKGPFIFDHLAIQMEEMEDLLELQDQLVCAELPVSDVIDHGFLKSIYTFDPNGIPLEFNVPVTGVDLNLNPVLADQAPPSLVVEGVEPRDDQWPVCEEEEDDLRIEIPGSEKRYFS